MQFLNLNLRSLCMAALLSSLFDMNFFGLHKEVGLHCFRLNLLNLLRDKGFCSLHLCNSRSLRLLRLFATVVEDVNRCLISISGVKVLLRCCLVERWNYCTQAYLSSIRHQNFTLKGMWVLFGLFFHVLHLLWIRFTQGLCCISRSMMTHQQKLN